MFALIAPMPSLWRTLLWPAAAIGVTAAYCLAYNALNGTPESLANALAWGLLMIAPWVMAVDLGRRLEPPLAVAALLLLAMAGSLLGEALLSPAFDPGFAAIRRLPGLAAAGVAIVVLRALEARTRPAAISSELDAAIVADCDWIEAAGNYIELHGGQVRRVLRCPIGRAETVLAGEFVRVHRSLLVRRGAIAAYDRGGIRLRCGRRLPIGDRYRARLGGSG